MNKTLKILLIILGVVAVGGLVALIFQLPDSTEDIVETKEPTIDEEIVSEKTIQYTENNRAIRIFNDKDELILEYSIEEFNEWAKENWDIFEETPQVGERDIEPENLGWFDEGASISPDSRKIAFSVHDYAIASYTSFVGVMEIETKELNLIKDYSNGSIDELIWSLNSTHIAYTLGTGRAKGDYFSVDNAKTFEKEFTLSGKELSKELNNGKEIIMPEFRELNWGEQGERIEFITNDSDEGRIKWSIRNNGEDLTKEEYKENTSY